MVALGDAEFLLHPYGSASGYPLVLTGPDYKINAASSTARRSLVTFRSEALWRESAARACTPGCGLGAEAGIDRCTGLNPCRGSIGLSTITSPWSTSTNRMSCRFAAKDSKHREGGRIQTLTFGRGDIVLRIYDKVAEIEQQSHKTWLFALWGGVCEDVWRIEWQVRKTLLRRFGIGTLGGVYIRAPGRRAALPGDRAHHVAGARRGDGNRSRLALAPAVAGPAAAHRRVRLARRATNGGLADAGLDERLTRSLVSVYGYVKRIAAIHAMRQGRHDVVPLSFLSGRSFRLQLQRIHDPLAWNGDVRKRIDEMRLGPW